ncbi:MAG: GNAT family N-acetyltransferase [Caulobacteraceae bacterium]
MLTTDRLTLRQWRQGDLENFAALHMDAATMVDTPPLTRAESEAKFRRYRETLERVGFCRWAVETRGGGFIGYVGILPVWSDHPLAPGVEIGWRLRREAWGCGYATEAARAALDDGFGRLGFSEVLSYTAPENLRSRAVMRRLGLERAPDHDFVDRRGGGAPWAGLVWVARRPVQPGRSPRLDR